MTDKYGFVYIWKDKKRKRFYIGSHWGTEDDGYICSSAKMNDNYRYRPHDFKRRIIAKITTNRHDLLNEEQRWLNMIKPQEFGFQYYNISNKAFCASWYMNNESTKQVKEKMRKNHWSKSDDKNRIVSLIQKGRNTPENNKKHSDLMKQKYASGEIAPWNKNCSSDAYTPEIRKKMSESQKGVNTKEELARRGKLGGLVHKGTRFITNGIINKRIHIDKGIPEGFKYGRQTKKSINNTEYIQKDD